ncbi:hypothetical protein [Morganella psychrotolerans]|uniref:Uncharacterized protein n=1 Tax=Morganella psychrotolerans TaxID=368603 RepID=A0A1B8HJR8_9GAMM|nr:hypothetical protein [Morganella psychrotolerans]OBU09348.1 hypothetical protein AYY17_19075 [Morganella psychrotolerans]
MIISTIGNRAARAKAQQPEKAQKRLNNHRILAHRPEISTVLSDVSHSEYHEKPPDFIAWFPDILYDPPPLVIKIPATIYHQHDVWCPATMTG